MVSAGDEKLWVDIHLLSEKFAKISTELYFNEFGHDAEILGQRQVFVLNADEQPVGTTTAWFNDEYHGRPYGRIHWVAIIPDAQGNGLSKPMMSVVCQRMRELGHDCAYLVTSTARIPAIYLYLKFGFVPEIRNEDDRRAWSALGELMGKNLMASAIYSKY